MGNLEVKIDQHIWGFPKKTILNGTYVDLEPLSLDHFGDLWRVAEKAQDSFNYLKYGPFERSDDFNILIKDLSSRVHQPFWAVIPKGGSACGWLSICDVYQQDGSIEIGSIWFSPDLQGTRASREAIYLLMCSAMDELQYERLVWRCQAQNEKSLRAAENLGFQYEGTWRNAIVVSGWQRDVAWFSILKEEWPACRSAFDQWLAPENFDPAETQIKNLKSLRPANRGRGCSH